MTVKRLFAIGEKNWIEIRSGPSPPKRRVSEAVKWTTEPQTWYGLSPPRKVRLISTTYVGGQVLGCVPTTSFRRLLKLSVLKGSMAELTKEQFERVKGKLV